MTEAKGMMTPQVELYGDYSLLIAILGLQLFFVGAVLGVFLRADQLEKEAIQKSTGEVIRSLQETMKALQEQLGKERLQLTAERQALEKEREINSLLRSALEDEEEQNEKLKKILEMKNCELRDINSKYPKPVDANKSLYPSGELEELKQSYPEEGVIHMRPLIKTETTGQGADRQTTTQTTPYTGEALAKIQEKYSRKASESETEYVWRVSLTGGDRILLSEDEARGFWGPGVFLTTNDNRAPWSLTQRAAYWAGGLDPIERGDPYTIKTPTIGHIVKSVQKTACLQLMHTKLLDPQRNSPMELEADPQRFPVLIRGLPDALKVYAKQLQERIKATPRPRRRGAPSGLTWLEIAQELIATGQQLGLSGTSGQRIHCRRAGKVQKPASPGICQQNVSSSGRKRYSLWREGVAKGIPREVMDKLPTANLEYLIKQWDKIKEHKAPPKGSPSKESNTVIPSASPETGLTSLTSSESRNWTYCSPVNKPKNSQWVYEGKLTENNQGDLVITFPLGPFKSLVTFVVDTGAQVSALQTEAAIQCGIKPDKKKIWVTDALGKSRPQYTAPSLPPYKIKNVNPYPLPLGTRENITPETAELQEQGVAVPIHSPWTAWSVHKPNGQWQLPVSYLDADTGSQIAAVHNKAELIAQIADVTTGDQTQTSTITHLESLRLQIPTEKKPTSRGDNLPAEEIKLHETNGASIAARGRRDNCPHNCFYYQLTSIP
ncbi:uncharacterized protein LOC135415096 [Pseudopipra pipra]|uniref:uncharacterized protein LOC135415096 n=1 Tax=Pseudopipra pipra TaxID=415032 RepID=UPI003139486B